VAPRRSPGRRFLPAKTVVASLAALVLGVLALRSHFTAVLEFRNGELQAASYRLAEDDFLHPRLRLLRTRERLDEVVASGKTQFDKIVLLREWAHRQWETGRRFRYPCWDAVEILDLARNHGNRAFCVQYAVVLLQACQSLGIHARYLNLPGHFVTGVWSDDFSRWLVMDPLRDVHYEVGGVPLGGWELNKAWRRKAWQNIWVVGPAGARRRVTAEDLASYSSYSINIDANQLSKPVSYWHNGKVGALVREADYRNYPVIGRDTLVFWNKYLVWRPRGDASPMTEGVVSFDPDDFRYPENQTVMLYQRCRGHEDRFFVRLVAENSSTFKGFQVRFGDGAWVKSPDRFDWTLNPGVNRLSCRILTSFGWTGPESRMSIFYWPSLF